MRLVVLHKVSWVLAALAIIVAAISPEEATIIVAVVAALASVAVGILNSHRLNQISINVNGRLGLVLEEVIKLRADNELLQQQKAAAQRVIEDRALVDAALAEERKRPPPEVH